jgi:hypothetical protein
MTHQQTAAHTAYDVRVRVRTYDVRVCTRSIINTATPDSRVVGIGTCTLTVIEVIEALSSESLLLTGASIASILLVVQGPATIKSKNVPGPPVIPFAAHACSCDAR